jgi:lipoate-protein ligase A
VTILASECRLLSDGPMRGEWNMAVDEMLLERAAAGAKFSLRFYGWSEATLSLGYFQALEERQLHAPSRYCPVVRRSSGGGAILHDAELTYSLSIGAAHPLAIDPENLYRAVHQALVVALGCWGVTAELNAHGPTSRAEAEPFLCFERRSPGDVLVGGVKIAGSAQRRRRGGILQHGSVLLRTSPAAPELPGIESLTGKAVSRAQLESAWLERLTAGLGFAGQAQPLNEAERRRAAELVDSKFGHASWTGRR